MGTKEIKKALWQYQRDKREYERLNRKIEEIEAQIMSISIDYSKEKVQGTSGQDKLADVMDMLTKLRADAIIEAEKMAKSMVKTYGMIEKVKDPLQKQILQMRYIEGLDWEEICYKIGYSWTHTHRFHKDALLKLGGGK